MQAMKQIRWTIKFTGDKIARLEEIDGDFENPIEKELMLIGVLEEMKKIHLNRLNTIYSKEITSDITITKDNQGETI